MIWLKRILSFFSATTIPEKKPSNARIALMLLNLYRCGKTNAIDRIEALGVDAIEAEVAGIIAEVHQKNAQSTKLISESELNAAKADKVRAEAEVIRIMALAKSKEAETKQIIARVKEKQLNYRLTLAHNKRIKEVSLFLERFEKTALALRERDATIAFDFRQLKELLNIDGVGEGE